MAETVDSARGTMDRGTGGKGTRPRQGNPGTFVRSETIDGVTYARYRAEENTWVSASLKEQGYDRQYGRDAAYGAYAGVARAPDATPLENPDRVRPGQEYLIPIAKDPQAGRIAGEPSATIARAVPPTPQRSSAADPTHMGSEVILPEARARQNVVGSRATVADSRLGAAIQESLGWEHQLIAGLLRRLIAYGTLAASSGRSVQEEHMEKERGGWGLTSDWLSDVLPPYIGAWGNANNYFVRASERLSAGDIEGALSPLVTGVSSLSEAQEAWDQYIRASIRGAGTSAARATSVRDASVGLLAGLAAGGPIGGVQGALLGGGFGLGVVAQSDSPLGEDVRGTLSEIEEAGAYRNMLLARQGLIGIAYGTGESLSEIPGSLAQLPKTVAKLLRKAGDILVTLFTDPARLARDLDRLPEAVALIYEALNNRWDWLKNLPPERQAFEIGRFAGHIEAALLVLEVGPRVGGGAGNVASGTLSGGAKGFDVVARQLVDLRAQVKVLSTEAATFTVVAMAAAGGPGGPGGTTGPSGGKPKKSPKLSPGDVAPYRQFRGQKSVEGHEVLQNLWLEVQGVIERRGKGIASRWNPSIALPPRVHDVVDRYQRALGLFDRAKVAKMSYKKVLSLNALALRKAGVPQSIIKEILEEALEHAVFSLARGY